MSLPKTLGQYNDVERVFQHVLRTGSATLTFTESKADPTPAPGKAAHWRMRAYYYRTRLHELQAQNRGALITTATETPYDDFRIRLKGHVLTIERTALDAILTDGDGNVVELDTIPDAAPSADSDSDDLLSEAEAFAKELEGKP